MRRQVCQSETGNVKGQTLEEMFTPHVSLFTFHPHVSHQLPIALIPFDRMFPGPHA
jgi:hypothetical protein